MSKRPITVDELFDFARRNNGREFVTFARSSRFILQGLPDRIRLVLPSNTYFTVKRDFAEWYVKYYNQVPLADDDLTTPYPARWRERSYMVRILQATRQELEKAEAAGGSRSLTTASESISPGGDWSAPEVEIIVRDYLTMLALELQGRGYNKSERNRELQKLLPSRTRGSIEFKHQNISAVMIELGYPYVEGYKPRINFQRTLLPEVVERQVYSMPELSGLVSKLVEQPAERPAEVLDLLSILVEPPARPEKREALYDRPSTPRVRPVRNYLEREARNQSLGRAGEELVLQFEHKRLWTAGQKTLAERIKHVSTEGEGHGFDILSFETDGRERLVEVKTTRFGQLTPFFASSNEVQVSDRRSVDYHVYRLFDFSKSPRLFVLKGSMRSTCSLEAIEYRAIPGAIED